MKVFKEFLVKHPSVLSDSYVSAASDGLVLGISIHDGQSTIALNFDLQSENGALAAQHTITTLERALSFLRKEGKIRSLQPPRLSRWLKRAEQITSALSRRKISGGCPPQHQLPQDRQE